MISTGFLRDFSVIYEVKAYRDVTVTWLLLFHQFFTYNRYFLVIATRREVRPCSCLNLPLTAQDWPGNPFSGPQGSWGFLVVVTIQLIFILNKFRSMWVHNEIVWYFSTAHFPILFCKYLSPLKSDTIGSALKIYTWISVFGKNKWFENSFFGKSNDDQIQ